MMIVLNFIIVRLLFYVFIFLWFLREAVADGEQGTAAHGVGPVLCATLRTDPVLETGHLAQEVVAAKFENPLALLDGLGECGIPIKAVVVHLAVGIASTRMYGEVCFDGEVPRQFIVAVEAIGEVPDVSGLLADGDVAMEVAIGHVALHVEVELLVLEASLGAEGDFRRTHTKGFGISAVSSEGKACALSVSQGQRVVDVPELLFAEGTVPSGFQAG